MENSAKRCILACTHVWNRSCSLLSANHMQRDHLAANGHAIVQHVKRCGHLFLFLLHKYMVDCSAANSSPSLMRKGLQPRMDKSANSTRLYLGISNLVPQLIFKPCFWAVRSIVQDPCATYLLAGHKKKLCAVGWSAH